MLPYPANLAGLDCQFGRWNRRRTFKISVIGENIIEVTPGSRSPRNSTRDRITRVLTKPEEPDSLRPEDTFNASYVLALAQLWQERT